MKLAFCLFKYLPYGGLARDFMRVAMACHNRGHEIHVYTMQWEELIPAGFTIHLIKKKGFSNHTQVKHFVHAVQSQFSKHHYDVVIGFNRMPDLDFYFCADVCYLTQVLQKHRFWIRYTRRFKTYATFEKTVFDSSSKTKIFYVAELTKKEYQKIYQSPEERFHFLPPGITKNTFSREQMHHIRMKLRKNYNLTEQQKLLLMVGSNFKLKGVDRTLLALASLPAKIRSQIKLFVIGKGDSVTFVKLAKKLAIHHQINFLGVRYDVRDFMIAADLLVHPSRFEAAGMVLVEALTNGLPVLVTENCGYAYHVTLANAGMIIPTPFQQSKMNASLLEMIYSPHLPIYSENALNYASSTDLYSMPEKVVQILESK